MGNIIGASFSVLQSECDNICATDNNIYESGEVVVVEGDSNIKPSTYITYCKMLSINKTLPDFSQNI